MPVDIDLLFVALVATLFAQPKKPAATAIATWAVATLIDPPPALDRALYAMVVVAAAIAPHTFVEHPRLTDAIAATVVAIYAAQWPIIVAAALGVAAAKVVG